MTEKAKQNLTEAVVRKIVREELGGMPQEFQTFKGEFQTFKSDAMDKLEWLVGEFEKARDERPIAAKKDRDQDARLVRLEVQVFGEVEG